MPAAPADDDLASDDLIELIDAIEPQDDEARSSTSAYLKEIGLIALLDAADERRLAQAARAGDAEARRQMIEANLRLVVSVARNFVGRGIPLLDLVAEGNLGLMRAVDRFDPERRLRFSTYAVWWIREAVQHALMHQARTVRVPVHVLRELAQVLRARRQLLMRFGRAPSIEELAATLNRPAPQVAELFGATERISSLDAPRSDSDDRALIDQLIVDPHAAHAGGEEMRGGIDALVAALPARERDVLERRYGLNDHAVQTLAEVAEEYGLTRERVRQIQGAALARLRKLVAARETGDGKRATAEPKK